MKHQTKTSHQDPMAAKVYRILVAEDDEIAQNIIGKTLEKKGFVLIRAENGAECLRLVEEAKPDLVLLDFSMPVLDGIGVLDGLRRSYNKSQLPVMMITSKGSKDLAKKALAKGVNDFLAKPLRAVELTDKIEAQFLRVDESDVHEILESFQGRAPILLSPTQEAALAALNLKAFSFQWAGLDFSFVAPKSFSAALLARRELTELSSEVALLMKPGVVWNAVWPFEPAHQKRLEAIEQALNREAEWFDALR